MGQSSSVEKDARTREDIYRELGHNLATKSLTAIELQSIKEVFKQLVPPTSVPTGSTGTSRTIPLSSLTSFLEIPEKLNVATVLEGLVSYISAFPFLGERKGRVDLVGLVVVVVLLSGRTGAGLRRSARDLDGLIWGGLAVGDEEGEECEDYSADLIKSALIGLHVEEESEWKIPGGLIPTDNLRNLLVLLLLTAPLSPQDKLSVYVPSTPEGLVQLRSVADCLLSSFLNPETESGISRSSFLRVIENVTPGAWAGLKPLFSHFLFTSTLDSSPKHIVQPILPVETALMTAPVLSQLSFFLPAEDLFRRVRPLYIGADDGFSMGSFESKVFNWRAPTILLVHGVRLEKTASSVQEGSFTASIPPRRFPPGKTQGKLTFGVYLSTPWKHTYRECFGESDTVLFQLSPTMDVFRASRLNKEYVTFTKGAGTQSLAFGCPHPAPSQAGSPKGLNPIGPVSLRLDAGLEFGIFRHSESGGGAFATGSTGRGDFEERFEIEGLEVWGCGGDEEAKRQAERWAWEEREAEARRKINLGTGDLEADRALLEMAGLIGGNRSGGSMM